METVHALAAQFAAFEALLLFASALHKVARGSYTHGVIERFARLPTMWVPAALIACVAGELAAGVLLLLPVGRAAGALLAVTIWALYLGLILRAIAQGRRDVDCGCSFGAAGRPLGIYQAIRNILLIALAILVALDSVGGDRTPVQGSQAIAAAALVMLYVALDQVMSLQPLRRGVTS